MRQRGGSEQPVKGRRANRPKTRKIAAPSVVDLQKHVGALSRELQEPREQQTATADVLKAFPWDGAPRYMIRDPDRIYGAVVTRRLRAMGIRDKPVAPASPWQNGFAERLIGSIRRECSDQCARSSWRDPAGESPAQARP
jgi:Integrase core domain